MMNEQRYKDIDRTDNVVKNFFYSKLRKALRKVNRSVSVHYGASNKAINESAIYKIIEITDERFKEESDIPQEMIGMSMKLKTWLYEFLGSDEDDRAE